MDMNDLAHEIWAAAQLSPGEGIEDGAGRIASLLTEVRAQDPELLRQLVEALVPFAYERPAREAIKAGRAWLKGKP